MALPTNREEFKQLCLRQLGKGAINIEITDNHAEDCIDMALLFYRDYAYDGSEKTYYKHQVTQTDKDNKYITLPDNIFGVVRVFPLSHILSSTNSLFSLEFQYLMPELFMMNNSSMIPYFMARQHVAMIEEILIGQVPIRYNRRINKLWLDIDWNRVNNDYYLMVEAYDVVDPEDYPKVWQDRWLIRYATALMKKQWGSNLIKFADMRLPGQTQFNAEKLYNDAVEEVQRIEDSALSEIALPVEFRMG